MRDGDGTGTTGLRTPPPTRPWTEVSERLGLLTPYRSLWEAGERSGTWMPGAELNLAVSCVERHLAERGGQVALHWEGEPGDRRSLTYAQLHEQVVALARSLRAMGVGVGDRVGLHLGWLPETVVAMLACARIGAVHTVLPAPLPAEPLADRLALLDLKVLFTQDGAWRHGTVLPLKARADEAMAAVGGIEHTVVVRRTGMDVQWFEGDRWLHDLLATSRPGVASDGGEAVPLPVDHPIATVPLANRGGQPVSIVHGTGTMLAGAIAVHEHVSTGGPFWCAGDIAWAVTQFHGIYGPLACGDTTVMYEGTLDVPNHQRAWDIIGRYGVEVLLTSPSVVRTVRGWAREMPQVSAVPSLRRVVTAGEPVEDELAAWMRGAFGREGLEVGDAWGQLELGGIVRVTGLADAPPLPDCGLAMVDHDGAVVPEGEAGEVVLTTPWAGTMVGVEGDVAEVAVAHWTRHPGVYSTGDLARRDPSGHVDFLGRTDDVVSISGQLVSLREVREVLTDHPYVRQAEVTWRKDPELGRSLVAAVTLSEEAGPSPDLDAVAVELMDAVRELLGGLARPRALLVLDRFGDELGRRERASAIATLATPDRAGAPRSVAWEQVLAAAGHPLP
ncbi:acyl-CoA synthetase [Ornithinimicrobium pekingense]|uniref:acetate--CoA ligase n=1 Tax=Ornithinimicrobium pekingense TaxID=384677 RepID=A0ABQ2F9S4_9MICO|nr:AMP-binding protein [Ornithinimicrobium pekingense]GGK71419.1 acetyl-coenzyme A synthetase [Ornithinimicrobium pekingense]